MVRVRLLTIGDELVGGYTLDRNGTWLARTLSESGCTVISIQSVGDDPEEITAALTGGADADAVICTGGLGPTSDDRTRLAAARFFGKELEFSETLWRTIQERFRSRGREPSETNRSQAWIFAGALPLPNSRGTAPGILMRQGSTSYFFLPGVPAEMRQMTLSEVLPRLSNAYALIQPCVVTFKTFGLPESSLYEKLRAFEENSPSVQFAYLPHREGIDLRLTLSQDAPAAEMERIETSLRRILGPILYGKNDDTLPDRVAALLSRAGLTLASAESCTGGLVSHLLTNIAGSSAWFERGFVVYSNQAKVEQLGVDPEILQNHGAVSSETAAALAKGARTRAGSDIGIATTGIAGPSGWTLEKPVGLVFIGYTDAKKTVVEEHRFIGDRLANKTRSALSAIDLVRRKLEENPI